MKNFTEIELQTIYNDLNNGTMYALCKNGYCTGRIIAAGDYIRFECYGSSAIKNNIKELIWLLTVLYEDFEDVTPAFYSYSFFNSVDLTGRYKSMNLNSKYRH